MQGLVTALESWRAKGLEIDILTTQPNRYATLKEQAPAYEDHGSLKIHRISTPAHQSGMIDQARAFMSFALGVRRLTRGKRWDLVFATSSRLMTAAMGAYVARRMQVPLYLDIRDVFSEVMAELLSNRAQALFVPLFRQIEHRTLRYAARINVVSEGFVPHIESIAPNIPIRVFTNGIDDMFLTEVYSGPVQAHRLPLILYAGNIGDGQGLHYVVPQAAKALEGRARFRIIGDGGKRVELEAAVAENGVTNVEVHPPVTRNCLLEQYREADILFLHLNDLDAFRKVLPSKLFEYAATGKPILAGLAGYASDFTAVHLPDVEVFPPCDVHAMAAAAGRLLDRAPVPDRQSFRTRFARHNIMDAMATDILEVLPANRFTNHT